MYNAPDKRKVTLPSVTLNINKWTFLVQIPWQAESNPPQCDLRYRPVKYLDTWQPPDKNKVTLPCMIQITDQCFFFLSDGKQTKNGIKPYLTSCQSIIFFFLNPDWAGGRGRENVERKRERGGEGRERGGRRGREWGQQSRGRAYNADFLCRKPGPCTPLHQVSLTVFVIQIWREHPSIKQVSNNSLSQTHTCTLLPFTLSITLSVTQLIKS